MNEMFHYRRLVWAFIFMGWAAILGLQCSGCGTTFVPYCGAPSVEGTADYIVDGEPSVDRRSTAFIQGHGTNCSATIIGPHTALTAAHCGAPTDLLVEDVAWFDITESIPHPDFAFPIADLNILHTRDVLPEPYATLATDDVQCTHTIAQGYGVGSGGELHEREVFEATHQLDQLLASTAIAPGDSGGPLWAITDKGPVLLGVASWGFGDAPNYEGGTGFVSVPYHLNWIREHVR